MAFGIVGLAACLCCKDVDSKMTSKVSDYFNTSFAILFEVKEMLMRFLFRLRCTWRTQILPTGMSITRFSNARIVYYKALT